VAEQRNAYKGTPPRPWIRLALVAFDGTVQTVELLADTGNPCPLIVDAATLQQFNQGVAPGMSTNFGPLDGAWFRVQFPDVGIDEDILGYGSDAVARAAGASHADFDGLAGLPLLRLMEYGGDQDFFWLRTP
jgi:hypothetical protein